MAEGRWSDDDRSRWDDDQRGSGYRQSGSYRDDDDRFGNRGFNRDEEDSGYGRTSRWSGDDDDDRQRPPGGARGGYGQSQSGYGQSQGGYGGRSGGSGTSRYGYGGAGQGSRYGENQGQRNSGSDRDWWERATDEVSSWMGDEDAERRRRLDKSQGAHRGKGPKGYTRADDRIREDVNDRLSDDSFLDASEIEVAVEKAEVTLSGTIDSREDKRRAEDIAEAVSGVKHVQNNLRVRDNDSSSGSRTSKAKATQA